MAAVTANVGFWATLALNIPDFSRYAKSQREQMLGQAVGLPLFMAAFSFVGVAVTSATVAMYGSPISDPIMLLGMQSNRIAMALGLFGVAVATLTTNVAANVVGPANALVNLNPQRISFTTGGVVTALLGIAMRPWKLVESSQVDCVSCCCEYISRIISPRHKGFIFTWLIGSSVVLGPIGGIAIADYYLAKKQQLDIDALYSARPEGAYWYRGGWNPAALVALAVGAAPCVPGLVSELTGCTVAAIWTQLYHCCWFVGFVLAGVVYVAASKALQPRPALA